MIALAEVFGNGGESLKEQVQSILRAVRRHLAMDVGFVSEFISGNRVFRFADGENLKNPVVVGASSPLEESFCFYVARGLMPELMHDAREDPIAGRMAVTHDLPVGAHLSVPLRHADGTPFGTLCCFSFTADRSLTTRDLGLLRICADVIGAVLQKDRVATNDKTSRRRRIEDIITNEAIDPVYQPICRIADGRLLGFEALSRFRPEPKQPPDVWFAEADAVGLGEELEFLALRRAMTALPHMHPAAKLTLNLSPPRVLSPLFAATFRDAPLDRIVIELTEHTAIECYDSTRAALAPARERGLRLAIDDVGAGHATFRHVLDLAPEFIKLDRSLICRIEGDSARRALAEAITAYSRRMGCEVVAEGVTTLAEYAVLRDIGVTRAQGFMIGHPMPADRALGLSYGDPLVRIGEAA